MVYKAKLISNLILLRPLLFDRQISESDLERLPLSLIYFACFFFCGIVATFSTFFVSRSQDVLLRVLCQIRTYTTLGRRENER